LTGSTETTPSHVGEGETSTKRRAMIMGSLMTIEEVAEPVRVSVPTVRWLRQEGRFAPATRIGRRLVWDRAELLAWVELNRESARVSA
jgi:excisionase family DNA binding protein